MVAGLHHATPAVPTGWRQKMSCLRSLCTTTARREDAKPESQPGAKMAIRAIRLARVQLDHQRFVDVARHVAALRNSLEFAFHFLRIDIDPGRESRLFGQRNRLDHAIL